ncbi:MAG: hypothetical protein ACHBNF_17335 [Chromatiales bacterium]
MINARAQHVPLRSVLQSLAAQSGMEIRYNDPQIADSAVSVELHAIPLDQALREILSIFSYLHAAEGAQDIVIVLSTPPKITKKSGAGLACPAAQGTPTSSPGAPLSEPGSLATATATELQQRASDEGAPENAQDDVLVEQAIDRLRAAPAGQAWNEAVDALVGIRDAHATEALVSAADTQDAGPVHRRYAVEALWRHAADLQFAEPASTEALRRLASDSNEKVRALAARAVFDMDRYLRSAQP